MKRGREKNLLLELEKIVEENKKLSSTRGLPAGLGPLAMLVGRALWQSLLLASGVMTLVLFEWDDQRMVRLVNKILLW